MGIPDCKSTISVRIRSNLSFIVKIYYNYSDAVVGAFSMVGTVAYERREWHRDLVEQGNNL